MLKFIRKADYKVTYNEIAHRTGVSTATISRVNRSLSYGAGGYQSILEKLEETQPYA